MSPEKEIGAGSLQNRLRRFIKYFLNAQMRVLVAREGKNDANSLQNRLRRFIKYFLNA